jgi:hypothetical protein
MGSGYIKEISKRTECLVVVVVVDVVVVDQGPEVMPRLQCSL